MKVIIGVAAMAVGANAYTSYNQPMAPGNENFAADPATGGFQPELEKGLSSATINVKYRHPMAKMDMGKVLAEAEEDAAFDAALQDAYLQFASDASDVKAAAGGLRRYSFLKQDPFASAMSGVKVGPSSDSSPYEGISELFSGMKFSARPAHRNSAALIDPAAFETVSSCDRDMSGCPNGFSSEGGACVATASYRGPCAGEAHDFASMSDAAKNRWQSQCEAFFPCKSCTRDYSTACPAGWSQGSDGSCSPGAGYTGSCGTTNFAEYNAAMLKAWSDNCGAQWQCA